MLKRILMIFPWLAVLIGIGLLSQPVITDWMYAKEAEEAISEVNAVYDDMDDPERLENLRQAQLYNARLAGAEIDEELWDYSLQLTYKGTPASMMAWVDIPKIQTRLPIFHYATEEVLSAGVGHMEWSSLPVGGDNTHCVISAHSGMQNTRMFDDIRKLEIGDTFVVWSLSEPYAYKVCDIKIVLPNYVEGLVVQEGRDLCTLVTCTPFGVNTHRLLVTGERCEYVEEPQTEGPSVYVNRRTTPLLLGIAVLLGLAILIFVSGYLRKKKKKKQEAEAK